MKGHIKPTAWGFAGDWAQVTQLRERPTTSGHLPPSQTPFCPQHSCCKALPQVNKWINNKGVTSAKRWAHRSTNRLSGHLTASSPDPSHSTEEETEAQRCKGSAQGGTAWEQRSQNLHPAPVIPKAA